MSARRSSRYNPACAGTTDSYRLASASRPIQPRVCGDYSGVTFMMTWLPDTPPRVRGLQVFWGSLPGLYRYNPACAGTTEQEAGAKVARYDTTPRVRGLQLIRNLPKVIVRYNPACAGTTCYLVGRAPRSQIQPRVCGDYQCAVNPSTDATDTTPRVRGLLNVDWNALRRK